MTTQAVLAEPTLRVRGRRIKASRIGLYAFLVFAAVCFITPLYVVIATSLKPMSEIQQGNLVAPPHAPTIAPWIKAWTSACTGLGGCHGISVGFFNSWKIVLPSVICATILGAINGYAMSFWRPKGAQFIFGVLIVGSFIPNQNYLFPYIRILSAVHLYNSVAGAVVVHVIFSMPILTLLFRNFYASLPEELFKAARVDGAGFWSMFTYIFLPMSVPIFVVAVIFTSTIFWNDFVVGLLFAGRDNLPMTVQLNNIINNSESALEYNVNMAAAFLTAIVPITIYFISGRWFVRGIAAGAIKG